MVPLTQAGLKEFIVKSLHIMFNLHCSAAQERQTASLTDKSHKCTSTHNYKDLLTMYENEILFDKWVTCNNHRIMQFARDIKLEIFRGC